MDGGETSGMVRVSSLQGLERRGALAHLADHDPIRSHPERVTHQIDDADEHWISAGQGRNQVSG